MKTLNILIGTIAFICHIAIFISGLVLENYGKAAYGLIALVIIGSILAFTISFDKLN